MSALIVLVVVILWAGFGFVLWRSFVRPHIRSRWALGITTLALAAVWFISPILDEILGASEFERLCREMPENKFYGAVALGPGEFFDELGQRKWKNIEELLAIKRGSKTWDRLFGNREEITKLRAWPIPILQSKSTDFERTTGRAVVDHYFRGSPGGWIKRQTGWGMHAPYQCPSKGRVPNYDGWIVFKAQ